MSCPSFFRVWSLRVQSIAKGKRGAAGPDWGSRTQLLRVLLDRCASRRVQLGGVRDKRPECVCASWSQTNPI